MKRGNDINFIYLVIYLVTIYSSQLLLRRKDELKPQFKIDHLVKERYPRFIDALRDLDDTLCMIHLFAAMPSEGRITVEHTSRCKELARQWQYYVARSKNLHKVFVSVKGIYYQAVIMGETVTWLVPHQFTQSIPREIDIRVMMTFLEFYEVFLKFVLFKLYGSINLKYPPEVNKVLDQAGCFLYAVRAKSLEGLEDNTEIAASMDSKLPSLQIEAAKTEQAPRLDKQQQESLELKLKEIEKEMVEESEDEGVESMAVPLATAFENMGEEDDGQGEDERRVFAASVDDKRPTLFASLKIFVNREIPLEWLQFCIVSFGGVVGWEGLASPFSVDDPTITHQVVDRPIQAENMLSREYIQPQWIFDCINAQFLLPVHKYSPGCSLPPHLSPFVDDVKEGYVPQYKEDLIRMAAGGIIKSAKEAMEETTEETDEEANEEDGVRVTEELEEDPMQEEDNEEPVEALLSKKGPKAVVFEPPQKKQTEVIDLAILIMPLAHSKGNRSDVSLPKGSELSRLGLLTSNGTVFGRYVACIVSTYITFAL